MTPTMQRLDAERRIAARTRRDQFALKRNAIVIRQREERRALTHKQTQRAKDEARTRQARFRSGLSGVWDASRGETRKIKARNEQEAWQGLARDRVETDGLVFRHLEERRALEPLRF